MITFPFPNIYLSFGYICYCFFFLFFDKKRNKQLVMPFTWSSFTLKEFKRSYIGQDAATNNETIKNPRVKYWKKMY